MDQSSSTWRIQAACESLTSLPLLRSAHSLEDYHKWCKVSEHLLAGYALADDTKLHALLNRMDASVQQLMHAAAVTCWADAAPVLERYFGEPATTESYLNVLDFAQQPGETVDMFALRLRKHAAESCKQNGAPLPGWVIREVFCNRVESKALRQFLREAKPATLDAAVDLATAKLECQLPQSLGDLSTEAGSSLCEEEEVASEKQPLVNQQVLKDVLEVLKLCRKNRTVVDYKRYCKLRQPGLTAEERKNILETPDDDKATTRLCLEVNVTVLPFCTFKLGRPLFTYVFRIPRLGRLVNKLSKGRPILTPGKWLASLEALVADKDIKKSV